MLAGLGSVGAGVLGAGVCTYLFLTLAARVLGPERFAPVSTLWALVFILGPGLFLPVQQELGRLLAPHRLQRAGAQVVTRLAALAGGAVLLTVLVAVAAREWLSRRLFDGQSALVWCLAAAVAAYALAFVARGILSGTGDYPGFGRLVAVESVVRLGVGLALTGLGHRSATAFAVAIAVAPLASTALVTRFGSTTRLNRGAAVSWRAAGGALGWLVMGSLLAQTLANAGPLIVQLLRSPDQEQQAGRFLSALVIARLGLYLFQAVQATLLPNVAELLARGRYAELRAALRRLTVVSLALVVVTTLGAWALGAGVVRLLFGDAFTVSSGTMAMLTCASGIYVLAAAASGVAIAASGHRLSALAWLVGCGSFAAGTTLSQELFWRVELGYLVGASVAAAVLLAALPAHLRRHQARHQAPVTARHQGRVE